MGSIRRPREGPEQKIKRALVTYLQTRHWLVEKTHGNLYQTGFPDLFLAHEKWGQRWVDVKQPDHYTFTRAQRFKWPLWDAKGVGIWILTGADQANYNLLFAPPNWRDYWRESWGQVPDIDALLDELNREALEGSGG